MARTEVVSIVASRNSAIMIKVTRFETLLCVDANESWSKLLVDGCLCYEQGLLGCHGYHADAVMLLS